MRLKDKVIIVTGSTQGIGKEIAVMCAAEGANVVINGLDEEAGQKVAHDIVQTYGRKAIFIKKDLSSELACQHLIEETMSHYGVIHGLVNNAGVYPRGTILETTEELFDSVFNVNVKGEFFCSKYAIKEMLKSSGGSIVQIGSTNGYRGAKELVAYSCSKGALLTLNKSIAAHYAKNRIRSNWITVGWVASEGEIALHEQMGISEEMLHEKAMTSIPTGKMQTGKDIAYGAVYLLSDESWQVTGTELHINGGLAL